ncbi:MAG: 50S ribosome-binding GTPase, partial [Candidatus Andersenbacteria bacterium]|nr:50S ribosome-binding GTPase [Candidatus Andersenbacteria bacterium]
MGFSVGIVGLPNVGKSTLFKALTKKEIDISNYPFCTIDPNVGIVKVPDERLAKLAKFSKSKKTIPTAIEFVDIAGLVKDAHKGEGLGNKFLSNIREVDMIIHIVRGFEDSNITHISGKTDPEDDIETINIELILADLETINKSLIKIQKDVRVGKKEATELQNILEKYKLALENEKFANSVELDENEKKAI